jgi:hypothetical protein
MPLNPILSIAFLENSMSRMRNIALSTAFLFSALALSACATKPKEVVAESAIPVVAPAEKAPEPAPAPAIAEQSAPAPAVTAAQVAPKQVVKKTKKKLAPAKSAPPKVIAPEPAPAPAPAPVAQQEVPPAPVSVAVTPLPVQKAEPGFLEKYWLWLLGVIIAAIAVVMFTKKG